MSYLARNSLELRSNNQLPSRAISPDRSYMKAPVRHRPPSPLKQDCDTTSDDRSTHLLALARQERTLFELREKKKELESQIRKAEIELHSAKKQLASNDSPLKSISVNCNIPNIHREKESETFHNLAEGVTAIWKDVLGATIGEQATT